MDVAQPIWLLGCPKEDLFITKNAFFAFLWDRMDGTQFLRLLWFPVKNNPPQTFLGGVYVLDYRYSCSALHVAVFLLYVCISTNILQLLNRVQFSQATKVVSSYGLYGSYVFQEDKRKTVNCSSEKYFLRPLANVIPNWVNP